MYLPGAVKIETASRAKFELGN